nr:hypothetical protein [Cressdnaviricota sp.]UOF78503.1 hypothetical protein [Cressdnaviricota sp.]
MVQHPLFQFGSVVNIETIQTSSVMEHRTLDSRVILAPDILRITVPSPFGRTLESQPSGQYMLTLARARVRVRDGNRPSARSSADLRSAPVASSGATGCFR